MPLLKWFATIYLIGVEKDGVLAERLANRILNVEEIAPVHGNCDRRYWLTGLVNMEGAYNGGRNQGK